MPNKLVEDDWQSSVEFVPADDGQRVRNVWVTLDSGQRVFVGEGGKVKASETAPTRQPPPTVGGK